MKQLNLEQPKIAQDMQTALESALVGQRHAIAEIVRQYTLFCADLIEPETPAATMLLAGPTGVGKTEFAYALAEHLCGTRSGLVKVDCGEYQYGHEIAKLVGSPPGYLGHRETQPILTNEVLMQYWNEKRISVLLFDEIEKAHSSLMNLLLGVLDKAKLTTGANMPVDFQRVIILLSSNIGFAEQAHRRPGFGQDSNKFVKYSAVETLESIRRKFSPEFLNRIKGRAVFDYISDTQAIEIAGIQLARLRDRLRDTAGVTLTWDKQLASQLVKDGFNQEYGARNIRAILYNQIVPDIAKVLINDLPVGSKLHIQADFGLIGEVAKAVTNED